MSDNIFLEPNKSSVWQRDNTNNTIYAEINGVRVAEIDSDGNFIIRGRYLKKRNLGE